MNYFTTFDNFFITLCVLQVISIVSAYVVKHMSEKQSITFASAMKLTQIGFYISVAWLVTMTVISFFSLPAVTTFLTIATAASILFVACRYAYMLRHPVVIDFNDAAPFDFIRGK